MRISSNGAAPSGFMRGSSIHSFQALSRVARRRRGAARMDLAEGLLQDPLLDPMTQGARRDGDFAGDGAHVVARGSGHGSSWVVGADVGLVFLSRTNAIRSDVSVLCITARSANFAPRGPSGGRIPRTQHGRALRDRAVAVRQCTAGGGLEAARGARRSRRAGRRSRVGGRRVIQPASAAGNCSGRLDMNSVVAPSINQRTKRMVSAHSSVGT
jgi:hypothetical protein